MSSEYAGNIRRTYIRESTYPDMCAVALMVRICNQSNDVRSIEHRVELSTYRRVIAAH